MKLVQKKPQICNYFLPEITVKISQECLLRYDCYDMSELLSDFFSDFMSDFMFDLLSDFMADFFVNCLVWVQVRHVVRTNQILNWTSIGHEIGHKTTNRTSSILNQRWRWTWHHVRSFVWCIVQIRNWTSNRTSIQENWKKSENKIGQQIAEKNGTRKLH